MQIILTNKFSWKIENSKTFKETGHIIQNGRINS